MSPFWYQLHRRSVRHGHRRRRNALLGTPIAAALLGAINAALGTQYGLYIGRVGLFLTTIIIIRVLPDGISGLLGPMADAAERDEVRQMRRGASWLKAENVAFVLFLAYLARLSVDDR